MKDVKPAAGVVVVRPWELERIKALLAQRIGKPYPSKEKAA